MNAQSNTNIFLIGPMGAGKTTVGKLLAQKLRLPFIDSDHVIVERTGVDIPTIFDFEGESGFRDREQSIIEELTDRKGIILATGGGAVLREQNRRHLSQRGLCIYLYCSVQTQLARTRLSRNRPLLLVEDPEKKLRELFEVRDTLYRKTAHHVVDSSQGAKLQLVKKILALYVNSSASSS